MFKRIRLMNWNYWDSDDFVSGLALSVSTIAIIIVYTILALHYTSWPDKIPFSIWWLIAPVAAASLILAVLSGWNDELISILGYSILIIAIPIIIPTAPVWTPVVWAYRRYRQYRDYLEKQKQEKDARRELKRILEQLKSNDLHQVSEGRKSFENILSDLDILPVEELTEAFKRIIELSPSCLSQVEGAYFRSGKINIREASSKILHARLAQPTIFTELQQMSRANWSIKQNTEVLGKIAKTLRQDGFSDICRIYALLHAAPILCGPDTHIDLISSMEDSDWSWAEDWLSEIFPGWPGWELVSRLSRWSLWRAQTERERAFTNVKIPTGSHRVATIQNIAIRVLATATELPHGKERYLTYCLMRDLEKVRFERDIITQKGYGTELLAISTDSLLYPQLVTRLADLIKVSSLLYRSERYGLPVTDRLAFHAAALGTLQSSSQVIAFDADPPDRWFLRRIVERWLQIVTDEIAKMKARAELEIKLGRTELTGPDYMLHITLLNQASGVAERVRIHFDPDRLLGGQGIHAQDGMDEFEFIRGGETVYVNLRLSVEQPGTFRLPFRIEYNDLEREDKVINFADEVSFSVKERSFKRLDPNPYIAGPPIKTNKMFFGRKEIFDFVEQNLPAGEQQNLIVLHGERRTGKTSILYQLKPRLSKLFVPILIDLQGAANRMVSGFWQYIALCIYQELQAQSFSIKRPELDAFGKDPFDWFRFEFLKHVYELVQDKRPVLLIDEFDVLENEVKAGLLPKETFDNLRHLMQHTSLCFVFAGTYDITKLGEDYWSVLFNTALWKRIPLLDRVAFSALVQDPVRGYFDYDNLALDRLWEMTSGHPFFIQLLCREQINHLNENRLSYCTVQDVNKIIEAAVDSGAIHLNYMWDGLSLEKKQFLIVVSELLETEGIAVLANIRSSLKEYGISLDLEDALKELKAKAILEEQEGRYSFPIGLVRKWIYETHSLESLIPLA